MKRYRKTERGDGLFSASEHWQAVADKAIGILKLGDLIHWESFRTLLEGLTGSHARLEKRRQAPLTPCSCSNVSCCRSFTA